LSKAKLYIGTSGYSYNHWKGVFYPKNLSKNKWLEHYALSFDTVELNVTFYRMPNPQVFSGWRRRTPKGFTFAVKGSRFITHIKRLKSCKDSVRFFFSRVRLLKEKLGVVLWQLPPSFKVDPKRLEKFIKIIKKYKNVKQAFEFRNESWIRKNVISLLKDSKIALCSADYPTFNKEIHNTAGFIYIRRHGKKGLYEGSYTLRELRKDKCTIKSYAKKKKDIFVYFNNDIKGYAVKNARNLKKITLA